MTLFMLLLASAIANVLYPLDVWNVLINMSANYKLSLPLSRLSPYYLFSEAATTVLNLSVRSIGIVTMSSLSGAIDSSLSLGQRLLLVWPHIVAMRALVIVGFAIAYVAFMKQELRT